jgi:hypothetical protein
MTRRRIGRRLGEVLGLEVPGAGQLGELEVVGDGWFSVPLAG